ncbi:MAG: hypothetical protein MJZ33_00295 [Paludibacteraceae bacterium]|nr:hypothetical protein [Paludibacteraceae bacterium]
METKSNILDSLKGEKNPFSVPKGYFEGLDPMLQKVIESKEKEVKEVKLEPFYSKLKPWLGVAASVALLVSAIQLISSVSKENVEQARINNTPEEINGIQTKILYTHLEDESIMNYLLSEEE